MSILLGTFLVTSAVRRTTLYELVMGDHFPIFVAGLLFVFNGFGLFSAAAINFSNGSSIMYWNFVTFGHFYPLTHPLILLFALYYPRPAWEKLGEPRVKVGLLALLTAIMLAISSISLFDKVAYYERLNLDILYYVGILSIWVLFTYWYRFKDTVTLERNCLSLLLVGFLFGPMNRWWVLYNSPSGISSYTTALWTLEYLLAIAFALFLIYTGYQKLRASDWGNRRERGLVVALAIALSMSLLAPIYPREGTIDPYDLGFGLVRPLCFGIAILQDKLFNINITKKVIVYTSITLVIGFLFFVIKNGLQALMPALGLLTIFIVSVIFLPLSAVSAFLAERLAPRIQGALRLRQDLDMEGKPVVETIHPLQAHIREMLVPRKLVFVIAIGFFIELLETAMGNIINYPALLSILFVGFLFSALDYLVDVQFSESPSPA